MKLLWHWRQEWEPARAEQTYITCSLLTQWANDDLTTGKREKITMIYRAVSQSIKLHPSWYEISFLWVKKYIFPSFLFNPSAIWMNSTTSFGAKKVSCVRVWWWWRSTNTVAHVLAQGPFFWCQNSKIFPTSSFRIILCEDKDEGLNWLICDPIWSSSFFQYRLIIHRVMDDCLKKDTGHAYIHM